MYKYYAQLNENMIAHTVCQLSGTIEGEYFIEINSIDESILGKRYNAETQEWELVLE